MLQSLFEVNVQILVGVVVVHILGHVEVDAADLVDERDEPLQVDGDVEVHGDAEHIFNVAAQLFRAAVIVGGIELAAVAHQRVARQADDIDLLVLRVKAHEHVRVAAAGVVVHTVGEDRIAVFFALFAVRNGLNGVAVLRRAVLLRLLVLVVRDGLRRAHDVLDRRHNGHGQEKKRQKRDDRALTAICAFLLFLRPAARLAFAADAWLVIVLLSHLVAPIIFLLVYNNAFYPARRNCARVILPRRRRTLYVRRKKSKKVSKSLVFFSRGHAAADVALGLVDLQHLLDLQV